MIEAIEQASRFTAGLDRDAFLADDSVMGRLPLLAIGYEQRGRP
jgi:hypothetical protein